MKYREDGKSQLYRKTEYTPPPGADSMRKSIGIHGQSMESLFSPLYHMLYVNTVVREKYGKHVKTTIGKINRHGRAWNGIYIHACGLHACVKYGTI